MVPLFSRVPTFVALEMPPQHIAREVGVTGAGGACGAGGGAGGGSGWAAVFTSEAGT